MGEQEALAQVDQVRLFRNLPGPLWRHRVYEQVLSAIRESGGSLRKTDVVIQHPGYRDPEAHRAKIRRNLRLARQELEENPRDAKRWLHENLADGYNPTDRQLDLTRAVKDKQLDLIAGNTTDGLIPALDLVVLEDDRHYFPPYEAVPIVREQVLAHHPEIRDALQDLAGKISDDQMRQLNFAVDGEHRDAKQVISEFLKKKHL